MLPNWNNVLPANFSQPFFPPISPASFGLKSEAAANNVIVLSSEKNMYPLCLSSHLGLLTWPVNISQNSVLCFLSCYFISLKLYGGP